MICCYSFTLRHILILFRNEFNSYFSAALKSCFLSGWHSLFVFVCTFVFSQSLSLFVCLPLSFLLFSHFIVCVCHLDWCNFWLAMQITSGFETKDDVECKNTFQRIQSHKSTLSENCFNHKQQLNWTECQKRFKYFKYH